MVKQPSFGAKTLRDKALRRAKLFCATQGFAAQSFVTQSTFARRFLFLVAQTSFSTSVYKQINIIHPRAIKLGY